MSPGEVMTGMAWDQEWRRHAMAAIGEGFCPQDHGLLSPDAEGSAFTSWCEPTVTAFASGGWCRECRVWWRITQEHDGEHVAASYPLPVPAIPPYQIESKSAAS